MKREKQIKAIIFDCDGTLINVSQSNRRVVEVVVNNYFKQDVLTQEEIRIVKGTIGYNNDWDATYALIYLIENNIPKENWSLAAERLLPIDYQTPLFKTIYAMFQTVYLGSELFKKLENGVAPFPYAPGLRMLESAFVDVELLKALAQKYKLGIATGRPYQEALLTLKQQGLLGDGLFKQEFVVGREATQKLKPNPEPILKAAELLQVDIANVIYVGDNISDVEAARRANIPCIFLGDQWLKEDGADTMINNVLRMLTSFQ